MDFPSKFLWAGNICDFFLSVRFCHRRRKTHAIAISVVSLESMVPSEVWALILSKMPPGGPPPKVPLLGTRPCPDHPKMLVYGESQECISGLLVCQNPGTVLQNDCIGAPRSECRSNQLGGGFRSGPLQLPRSRGIRLASQPVCGSAAPGPQWVFRATPCGPEIRLKKLPPGDPPRRGRAWA